MDKQIEELEYKTRGYGNAESTTRQGSSLSSLSSLPSLSSFSSHKKYLLIPIAIFIMLLVSPPWFVRSEVETDDGDTVSVINYKSVFIYTTIISVLILLTYMYVRKRP